MRIKRAAYRHIEAEIYSYSDTLRAIAELREDIIYGSQQDELGTAISGTGYVGSAVERRATRLADSVLLAEMERITQAIRDTYVRLGDDGRRVTWLKYQLAIDWEPPAGLRAIGQGQPHPILAAAASMEESTFYRHRAGFVYGIAERLGWY